MQDKYKKFAEENTSLVSKRLKRNRLMLGISLNEIDDIIGIDIPRVIKKEKNTDYKLDRRLSSSAKFFKSGWSYFINCLIKIWKSLKLLISLSF